MPSPSVRPTSYLPTRRDAEDREPRAIAGASASPRAGAGASDRAGDGNCLIVLGYDDMHLYLLVRSINLREPNCLSVPIVSEIQVEHPVGGCIAVTDEDMEDFNGAILHFVTIIFSRF